MTQKEPSEGTDQELIGDANKTRSTSIINAFLIGTMIGILIYGVSKNNLGLLTLIPLFLVYKVFNNSTKKNASEAEGSAEDDL